MRAEPAAVPRLLLRAEGLPPAHLAGCRSLLAAFRPGLKTAEDEGGLSAAPCLRARRDENGAYTVSYFTAGADEPQQTFTLSAADCAHIASFPRAGREDTGQILLKRAVSGLMTALTGRVLPWGILVGVRPGKLADIMTERGWPPEEQAALLTGVYGVRPDKAALLLETAERQRPFFAHRRDNPSRAALYIAIPFCPSRCVYCSFPATVLTARVRPSYDAYLRELAAEIERAGAALRARGLVCDSVYLGGGTPAILSAAETEFILAALTRAVPLAPDGELTFEAGRPELVTAEKLRVLAAGGVNRLSINPQTMNDATLVRIGRPHTAADTGAAFALARAEGDWRINMDLIRGLPGETDETLAASLDRVLALRPDNVTLHALARKRGAALAQTPQPEQAEESDVYAPLRAAGYLPYYLYRQKNSAAGGENTGWALPGAESRYNIAMMEEALMVWGLGAGAASKLPAGGGRHDNVFEPADLGMYLRRDRRDWRKAGLSPAAAPAEDT